MSQEQKSIKDLYDLLLAMSGGGATTQDVVDAINYISYNETYNLKTVVSELSQSNTDTNNDLQIALGQLFSGDDLIFGKSLLVDQTTTLTAAQILTLISSLVKKEYKKAVAADIGPTGTTAILYGLGTPEPSLISGSLTIKVMNKSNRDMIFGQGTTSGGQLVYAPTNTLTDITAVCNVTNSVDLFEVYIRSANNTANGILYFTMEGAQ